MRSYSVVALSALALALSLPLSGCQTPEQSAASAENTCAAQGLHGWRYERCVHATYDANREQSQEAANATGAAVAAGVIGGVLVGSALDNGGGYYHHHHHCYHCW